VIPGRGRRAGDDNDEDNTTDGGGSKNTTDDDEAAGLLRRNAAEMVDLQKSLKSYCDYGIKPQSNGRRRHFRASDAPPTDGKKSSNTRSKIQSIS
jgi:hypothetical protein